MGCRDRPHDRRSRDGQPRPHKQLLGLAVDEPADQGRDGGRHGGHRKPWPRQRRALLQTGRGLRGLLLRAQRQAHHAGGPHDGRGQLQRAARREAHHPHAPHGGVAPRQQGESGLGAAHVFAHAHRGNGVPRPGAGRGPFRSLHKQPGHGPCVHQVRWPVRGRNRGRSGRRGGLRQRGLRCAAARRMGALQGVERAKGRCRHAQPHGDKGDQVGWFVLLSNCWQRCLLPVGEMDRPGVGPPIDWRTLGFLRPQRL
mmetsp:Transcript_93293/g.279871  ORF Transcript_93293/g.279871 Transcript_93293/m.279871 type:complete len:255 (-) Transcript_93293:1670-2434(-)